MLPRIHPDRMQIAFDDHCAPASSLFYWNRAWPVRLPLPISPCVNARAHRFGGFGLRSALLGSASPKSHPPWVLETSPKPYQRRSSSECACDSDVAWTSGETRVRPEVDDSRSNLPRSA